MDDDTGGDADDGPVWPPAAFAREFQEAGGQTFERQAELYRQLLGAGSNDLSGLPAMSMGTATFKARVQSGGRISIPDTEREALDIEEGDLVQTIVIPISKSDQ